MKPILFSGPMVQAIMRGGKTQTRRIVKPQPYEEVTRLIGPKMYEPVAYDRHGEMVPGAEIFGAYCEFGEYGVKSPDQVGNTLWVRETWRQARPADSISDNIVYRADKAQSLGMDEYSDRHRWKPSIHMPRKYARLFLTVTGVRVERLQDISEADAISEGAFFTDYGRNCFHNGRLTNVGNCPAPIETHPLRPGWSMVPTTRTGQCIGSAKFAFANYWESLNAKRAPWSSNPWVWVYEFKRQQR